MIVLRSDTMKKYLLHIVVAIFVIATIYFFLTGMNFRNLLIYLYFDFLFGIMLFKKYSSNHKLIMILYIASFSVLTIVSFLMLYGFMIMIILMLDVVVGFLAYKEYSELY